MTMARHIWKVEAYEAPTIRTGMIAYRVARQQGADVPGACRFAGYYLERLRQGGRGNSDERPAVAALVVWRSAYRCGQRYARGKNRENYERAGRNLLLNCLMVEAQALNDETLDGMLDHYNQTGEWQALRDYLEEMGHDKALAVMDLGETPRIFLQSSLQQGSTSV